MQMAVQSFSPKDVANKVELSISCTNLKDLDHFSKSDPAVFLYEKKQQRWELIDKTEVIDNNLNPKFSKVFLLDYFFEEIQQLKFVVYDIDDRKNMDDVRRHDRIGEMECTLADIVTAGQQYKRTLREKGASRGQIIIVTEEVQDSKYTIHMEVSASKLDKKDLFGKSDPFFEIAKAQEGGSYTVVYRSKPILKTLDPRWPRFEIPIRQLCSGDWDRTLKISVWDWNRSGDHDYIGSCSATLREICPEKGGQIFNLDIVNESLKQKKKKYRNSGTLTFVSVKSTPLYSFVDFIKGGCQINLVVAVDFTASNGKPQDPSSLHYRNQYNDNSYMAAIKAVGSVLAPYDSDQLIPAYGFGARIPPSGEVSHCFPLNLNEQRPDVFGVEGILEAYNYVLGRVDLYGPTNFSYFLDKVIGMAKDSVTQESQSYYILLVITDGVISDMPRTTDRIVEASKLPLSIVIVGVGGADFSNMEVLDADDNPLRNRYGETMSRDIVQFVPFRKYQKQGGGANFALAKETLAEIPEQLLSFMKSKGIKPNPPPLKKQQTSMFQHQQPPPQGPYGSQVQYPGGGVAPSAPYPAGSNPPGTAPYPARTAPYPAGSNPPPGTAPYPAGSNPPPGTAPYPAGSNPPPGTASYPTGTAGSAPYPAGSNPPPGTAPYPAGAAGTAPYPAGSNPNSSPPASAPYYSPQQQQTSTAPYPTAGGGSSGNTSTTNSSAPYP